MRNRVNPWHQINICGGYIILSKWYNYLNLVLADTVIVWMIRMCTFSLTSMLIWCKDRVLFRFNFVTVVLPFPSKNTKLFNINIWWNTCKQIFKITITVELKIVLIRAFFYKVFHGLMQQIVYPVSTLKIDFDLRHIRCYKDAWKCITTPNYCQ